MGRTHRGDVLRTPVQIEQLEDRSLLSAANVLSSLHANTTYQLVNTSVPATSVTYTPSQIQSAYGFNRISNNGSGQTIAIIDAYDDPTIQADLARFDTQYGIAAPPSFRVLSQTGSTTNLPGTDPTKGWETEEALDVEWAHALAPGASIVLVEANSASDADLFAAVTMAANLPGVSVVSMSFGGGEFSQEAFYDSVFTTPAGHQGVTFLASTGDNGAPGGFPAYSSNVVAVGGTTLTVDSSGNYVSESAWSGSGGGISQYESQPTYQQGIVRQTTTKRAIPDVSFDADPNSGVVVCNSFTYGTSNPWITLGGTSFSAPAWAAIIAIADQGRAQNGLGTLDGATQTLPMLYQLSQSTPSAFHDITTGNNGHAAGTGYDLVTGLGSPVVDVLTNAMSGGTTSSPSSKLVIQHSPTSGTAGVALGAFTVAVEYQNGQIITSDHSTMTLTLSSGTFSTGSSTATATVVNGIASFSNLTINTTGTYQITVSDSATSATVTSGNIVIAPAAFSRLAVQQNPTTGTAGVALAPAVKVAALDQFGNLVTTSMTVTLTLTGGMFSNRTTTVTATTISGVATFSSLIINTAGNYTLAASVVSLTGPSFNVAISAAAASKLVWQTAPAATAVAGATLGSIVITVQDAFGNVVTTDNSTVTLTLSSKTFHSGSSTATATAVNGVASFSSLAIDSVGTFRITASDSASLGSLVSGSVVTTPTALGSLVVQQNPTTGTAGINLAPAVKVQTLDQFGNIVTDSTTVTLTLTGGVFATGSTTVTATTTGGVATFSSLIINTVGNYTLTASVGSLAGSSFTVAIIPATAKQPVWQTAPASTAVAGTTLTPVLVTVNDAFGNQVTSSATVTMKLTGGKFANGSTTVTVAAVNGVATFDSMIINIAGSYTLTASVGLLSTSTSNVTVSPAAASKLVWQTAPVTTAVAGTTLNPVLVAVVDAYGNVVTTDHSTVTLTLNNGTFSTGSSTVTATAANGVATFSHVAINTTGIYQVTASDSASLTTVTSANIVMTPAALSSLAVQQNPTTGTAGFTLAPAVKVAALDQYGNLVTASTSVTLTLTGGSFSNGSTTVTANTYGGIATFSNLIINIAGNYSLTASVGSLASPTFNVAISPAAAKQPVWQTAPSSTAVAGTTFSSIVVAAEDAFGNLVATSATVTLRLSGGKFANGTTSEAATTVNGIATFSDLVINIAGNYSLSASVGSMTTAASSVTVGPAAASQLAWQTPPAARAVAGTTLSPVLVKVEDAFGNVVTTDHSTVTLTLSSGTFSTGSSTATATAVNGIATFASLILNTTGTYQLTASDSASLTTVTSGNVVITPAALSSLAVQQNPTTATAGVAFAPAVKVAALDQFGNLLATSTIVTLTLSGGTFSNRTTTVSASTVGGIATFSNLIISATGNYTLSASTSSLSGPSFNVAVSPAAASKLVWTAAPGATAVAGTTLSSIVVTVEDAFGNVVTADNSTVTLTMSSQSFSTGASTATATVVNGVATFGNLAINTTGSYRITASDSASLTTVTSGNVVITPAALSSLVIQQNPTTGTAGIALSPTVRVSALDQFGNLVTASTTVTLTLTSGSFATGSTTVTANTTGGISTFSGLIINTAGNYTLTVSVGSLTGPSFNLTINPAAAKQPVWQTPPAATAVAGNTLSPILVTVDDAFGNQITGSASVTMKITGGKFANGSTSVTVSASGGVATFDSLVINAAGTYTLTASVGSMNTSASNLTVSPAAASKLVWKTAPSITAVAGTTLNSVLVAVEDTFGNVVTTDHSTVTLTLSTGTFSTSASTVTATAASGIATFNSLAINTTGTYQLTASDSASLTTVTSGNLVITPAALSSLAVQQNPTTGTAGVALAPVVKVAALDQYGNFVMTSNTITLTLTGGSFANGSTTVTANTIGGVATFSNLIINVAGQYTLTASVGSLAGPAFNLAISPAAAKQPVWQTAPSATAVAGSTLNSIVVAVNDAYGNQVTTDTTVTLRLSGGKFSDGSTMVTVTSVNGIATFSGLSINSAGHYTLTASVGVTSTSASSVTINPAAASKLVWQTTPAGSAVAGTTLRSVVVAVEDVFGNVVTSDSSTVTLTLSSGTFSTGSATATATVVNGLATFGSLSITTAGTYQVTASDSSLSTLTSGNVVITASH